MAFDNRRVSAYDFTAKVLLNQLKSLELLFKSAETTLVWIRKTEIKQQGHTTYLPAYKYTCIRKEGQGRCSALARRPCCRGDLCSF